MVGLRNRAVLEIDIDDDSGTTRTCVFELREDLAPTGDVARNFLLAQSGQYVRKVWDIGTGEAGATDNRRGYHVDGGAGGLSETISATAGDRDLQWGDGSTDPDDPTDISKYDATGCDPVAQKQIFEYVNSQASTGSTGRARLHIGEWTDGSHGTDAGVFESPLVVAIPESSITSDPDDPGALDVTLTLTWTAVYPEIGEEIEGAVETLSDAIPEF